MQHGATAQLAFAHNCGNCLDNVPNKTAWYSATADC